MNKQFIHKVSELLIEAQKNNLSAFSGELPGDIKISGWVHFGKDWQLQLLINDESFDLSEDDLWELAAAIRKNEMPECLFSVLQEDVDVVSLQVTVGTTFHGYPEDYFPPKDVAELLDIDLEEEGLWMVMNVTDYAS